MKTTFKILMVLFAVVAITACGGKKVDDATKASLTKIQSDWGAMMTDANNWKSTLQAAIDKMKQDHDAMMAMPMDPKMAADMKAKSDADAATCTQASSDAQALMQAASAQIADWQKAGDDFGTWMKDIDKAKPEDATAKVDDYNKKMTDAKAAMADWQKQWSDINGKYMTAMEDMKMVDMPPAAPDKKGDKDMKKSSTPPAKKKM